MLEQERGKLLKSVAGCAFAFFACGVPETSVACRALPPLHVVCRRMWLPSTTLLSHCIILNMILYHIIII